MDEKEIEKRAKKVVSSVLGVEEEEIKDLLEEISRKSGR